MVCCINRVWVFGHGLVVSVVLLIKLTFVCTDSLFIFPDAS